MTVVKWIKDFEESVCVSELGHPQAVALVRFLDHHADDIASFVEARRQGEKELIIVNFRTGRPQDPFYPIQHVEKVGILFREKDLSPLVFMLRDDFPDTEHQLIFPEGYPACICIDDRPWEEARVTWTAADLINRIFLWFRRAGVGDLHDARQPLDPNLLYSAFRFIVAGSILTSGTSEDLIAECGENGVLRVRRLSENPNIHNAVGPICILTYQVPPELMQRMRYIPNNLGQLKKMLADRGIDLYDDLGARFKKWLPEGMSAAWRFNSQLAIIVKMPIVSPSNEQEQGDDLRAFVTMNPVGEIAVGLGVAFKPSGGEGASNVGYVLNTGQPDIDYQAVDPIKLVSAEVHLEFERSLATRLAGRDESDTRKVVLVGAGAIGSHLANCLVREGRFCWTIIDNDLVLPHNLARHIALNNGVCFCKAEVLAAYLNSTLADMDTKAEWTNRKLLAGDKQDETVTEVLNGADLIIDATASVSAMNSLSDHGTQARRFSAFFNPLGEAAILLAEPVNRKLSLRDLEAQYFGLILHTKGLAEHLKSPETIAYTGACRAITNRIPESRVSILSGLAANGMSKAVDSADAVISVWSLAPNGRVTFNSATPKSVSRFNAHGWTITIDSGLTEHIHAMRKDCLPNETGGVLFGRFDIPNKLIHLVDASAAPPDSKGERSSFERGTRGVRELIESVESKTMSQVRYVGEWHSHPPNVPGQPSFVDLRQLDWLAEVMDMDCMPALMLIAADQEITVMLGRKQAKLI